MNDRRSNMSKNKNLTNGRSRTYVVKAAESRPRDVQPASNGSRGSVRPTDRDRQVARGVLRYSRKAT